VSVFDFPAPEPDDPAELTKLRAEVQERLGQTNAGLTRFQVVPGDVVLIWTERRCPECHGLYVAGQWALATWNHQYVVHEDCAARIGVRVRQARRDHHATRFGVRVLEADSSGTAR
jgi:hypothetical protein